MIPELAQQRAAEIVEFDLDKVARCRAEPLAPLANLGFLGLSATKVDDAALSTVAQFPLLEVLDVSETAVTDVGVAQVDENSELHALNVRGTKVTAEHVERLRQARPKMQLVE